MIELYLSETLVTPGRWHPAATGLFGEIVARVDGDVLPLGRQSDDFEFKVEQKVVDTAVEQRVTLIWKAGPARLDGFEFKCRVRPDGPVNVPGPFWPNTYIRPDTPAEELEGRTVSSHTSPDGGFGMVSVGDFTTWLDTRGETAYAPTLKGQGGFVEISFFDNRQVALREGSQVVSATWHLNQVSGISGAMAAYREWCTARYPLERETPEWVTEMVLLEAYPENGGFQGIRRNLKTYRDTGFNTLYLMPHWLGGYMPVDLFQVDPKFGTQDELRALVDEAHELGMRVLFDSVIHGMSPDSELVQRCPELFISEADGAIARHPAWKSMSTDWAAEPYLEFVERWVRHDVETYGIDGYRVDAAGFKGPNWNRERSYESGSNSPEAMRRMLRVLRSVKPDSVLLNEVFGPVFYGVSNLAHDNQCEAIPWMIEQVEEGLLDAEDYQRHIHDTLAMLPEGANRVFYSRNHDTSWFGKFGGYSPTFFAFEAIHAFCGIPSVFGGDPENPPLLESSHLGIYRALFSQRSAMSGELDLSQPSPNRRVFGGKRGSKRFYVSLSGEEELVAGEGRWVDPISGGVFSADEDGLRLRPYQVLVEA